MSIQDELLEDDVTYEPNEPKQEKKYFSVYDSEHFVDEPIYGQGADVSHKVLRRTTEVKPTTTPIKQYTLETALATMQQFKLAADECERNLKDLRDAQDKMFQVYYTLKAKETKKIPMGVSGIKKKALSTKTSTTPNIKNLNKAQILALIAALKGELDEPSSDEEEM